MTLPSATPNADQCREITLTCVGKRTALRERTTGEENMKLLANAAPSRLSAWLGAAGWTSCFLLLAASLCGGAWDASAREYQPKRQEAIEHLASQPAHGRESPCVLAENRRSVPANEWLSASAASHSPVKLPERAPSVADSGANGLVRLWGGALAALSAALVCGMAWNIQRLNRTCRRLEKRVVERTGQLAITDDLLRREIEDRKVAEENVETSRRFLQQVLDSVSDEIIVIDPKYQVIYTNRPEARSSTGNPKSASHLKCYEMCRHTKTSRTDGNNPCPLQEILASRETMKTTHTHAEPDGRMRTVEIIATPVFDDHGEVCYIIEVGRDITERMRAEERLHLLSNAVEQSREGIAVTNMDGHVLFANTAFAKMHGFSSEEVVGRHFSLFHAPEQMPALNAAERQVRAVGFFQGELWHAHRNGSVFPTLVNNVLLQDADKRSIGVIVCARDIRDLKYAEMALRRSEKHFRSLIENASDIIIIADCQSEILYVSPSMELLFGFPSSECVGRSAFDFLHPEDRHGVRRFFERAAAYPGMSIGAEARFRNESGAWRTLEIVGKTVAHEDGEIEVIMNARDITDRREAEKRAERQQRQLERASKLATLGTLVAGVAHEINNPNFLVMANTSVLRAVWKDVGPILEGYYRNHGDFLMGGAPYSHMRGEILELLDGIQEGGKRIKRIVEELRDYARERPADLAQTVDINAVVKSATALLGNMLKKATNCFRVQYGNGIPTVHGDPQRLEQVVINLIQNACQALSQVENAISVHTYYAPDIQCVIVEVQDEGRGIPEPELSRITDPFFTTRRDSGGSGLGLSISSSIMDAHGGRLEFISTPGEGTTAKVILPVTPGSAQ